MNFIFIYLLQVGAGSAGSVIANRLTEDADVDVLLIEAGGSDLNNGNIRIPLHAASLQLSYEDWAYYTVPQKHSQRAMNEQVLIINYNRSLLHLSRLTSYSSSNKPIIPVIMVYPNIKLYKHIIHSRYPSVISSRVIIPCSHINLFQQV